MDSRDQQEYWALIEQQRGLVDALNAVRKRMAELSPPLGKHGYRLALRPDESGADPMKSDTLLDDIVVNNVTCFRAEQMDRNVWWVACYLDDDTNDRICWDVRARSKPNRIEWTTIEFPETGNYEHELGRDGN